MKHPTFNVFVRNSVPPLPATIPLSACVVGLAARFRKNLALLLVACYDDRFLALCGQRPLSVSASILDVAPDLRHLCDDVSVQDCGSYVTGVYRSQATVAAQLGALGAFSLILVANCHGLGRFLTAESARKTTVWAAMAACVANSSWGA